MVQLRGFLLQIPMAVRIAVVLALLFAFAYGFATLVERYGSVGDQPSPCEEWSNPDCADPAAPPSEPQDGGGGALKPLTRSYFAAHRGTASRRADIPHYKRD